MLKKLTQKNKTTTTERFAKYLPDLCTTSCTLRCYSDPALNYSQFYFISHYA